MNTSQPKLEGVSQEGFDFMIKAVTNQIEEENSIYNVLCWLPQPQLRYILAVHRIYFFCSTFVLRAIADLTEWIKSAIAAFAKTLTLSVEQIVSQLRFKD